ncbi:MAG: hypothetical protein QXE31_00800 [Candidatus Woesearchaeota archaeon]
MNTFYPQKKQVIYIKKVGEKYDESVGFVRSRNSTVRLRTPEYDRIYYINSEGFVDKEWQINKKPGEYRIVILGDSFPEAVDVKIEDRFSSLLEKKLNKEKFENIKEINVMNFAVGGYSTCNSYLVLKNKSLKYSPDLVILFIYNGNDFEDNMANDSMHVRCILDNNGNLISTWVPNKETFSQSEKLGLIDILFSNTNIGSLFMNNFRYSPLSYKISKMLGLNPEYAKIKIIDMKREKENKILIEHTAKMIKGMNSILKKNNIKFLVVMIPDRVQVDDRLWNNVIKKYNYNPDEYIRDFPERYLSELLKKEDIDTIALFDIFKNESNKKLIYFPIDRHLNEEGHKIVSNILYDYVKEIIIKEDY